MTAMPKLSLAGKAFPVEDTEQKPGKLPTVYSGVLADRVNCDNNREQPLGPPTVHMHTA